MKRRPRGSQPSEAADVVVSNEGQRGADTGLNLQPVTVVIVDRHPAALDVRGHLDARVLRRLLHGVVPFAF